MNLLNKKKILVTHNGTFHADDIFSAAVLSIYLKNNIKIIRTRDPKIIEKGDYVFDIGGIYDADKNLFDHHQKEGAGQRKNGVPYASIGLVWKKFGKNICGDEIIAEQIDQKLIQFIDANDNGINTFEVKDDISPYTIQDVFYSFRPSFSENQDHDKIFLELVDFAKKILLREVVKMKDSKKVSKIVQDVYENTEDKRLIVLDENYPWGEVLGAHTEPIYVVYPKVEMWRVECVRKEKYSFENRKPLPESWAGKRDGDLASITGVSDAVFCHNGRFLVVAKSKESAIKLAEIALNTK